MFSFQKNFFHKDKSLQKYIDGSLKKSLDKYSKLNKNSKNSFYFEKYPIVCDLNYLKCDYDWSKQELFKYLDSSSLYFNKVKHNKNLFYQNCPIYNNFSVDPPSCFKINTKYLPFLLYFAFTSTFLILENPPF